MDEVRELVELPLGYALPTLYYDLIYAILGLDKHVKPFICNISISITLIKLKLTYKGLIHILLLIST